MTTGVHASDDTDGFKSKAKYCLKCAGRLEDRIIEDKAHRACTACDFVFYQDPKPVAGVLAVRNGNLLLIQRGNEPKRGLWSFPTGYIDVGDSPEETAIREAKEEANVDIRLNSLLGVYSDKRRTVVLVIYTGTIASGNPAAGAEALDARLFYLHDLPKLAFDHDTTSWRIYFQNTPGHNRTKIVDELSKLYAREKIGAISGELKHEATQIPNFN